MNQSMLIADYSETGAPGRASILQPHPENPDRKRTRSQNRRRPGIASRSATVCEQRYLTKPAAADLQLGQFVRLLRFAEREHIDRN